MELKFTATIELGKAELQKMIEDWVKKQASGATVKSVTFDCGISYDQFDRGPGQPVFKSVKVVVEPTRASF